MLRIVIILNVWHLLIGLLFCKQIFGRVLSYNHIFLCSFNVVCSCIWCALSLTSDVVGVIVVFLHVGIISHGTSRAIRVDSTDLVQDVLTEVPTMLRDSIFCGLGVTCL